MSESIKYGIYKHYKGGLYKMRGIARHSESLEELVLYETLYENKLGKLWVRPRAMFFETVTVGDYTGPRFALIQEEAAPVE